MEWVESNKLIKTVCIQSRKEKKNEGISIFIFICVISYIFERESLERSPKLIGSCRMQLYWHRVLLL